MTALDEERLSGLRQLVPPVLSPPISDVYRRATRLRRRRRPIGPPAWSAW